MHTISTDPVPVARRGTARKINQQIVLDLIRRHQPISRADLARSMGVSRAMVGYWVDQLIERGALYDADSYAAAAAGRPDTAYAARTDGKEAGHSRQSRLCPYLPGALRCRRQSDRG